MSFVEYRWLTRQLYTAIVSEAWRDDGDPGVKDLVNQLQTAARRQNGIGIRSSGNSGEILFNPMLDFRWVRVPETTRAIVRNQVIEIGASIDAVLVDQLLLTLHKSDSGGR